MNIPLHGSPASIPVRGTFDDYGRVDGIDLQEGPGSRIAFVHEEMWDSIGWMWDKRDSPYSLLEDFVGIKKQYEQEIAMYERLAAQAEDPNDHFKKIFDDKHQLMSNAISNYSRGGYKKSAPYTRMKYIESKFFLAEFHENKNLSYEESKKFTWVEQNGKFEKLIVDMLLNGWDEKQVKDIETLVTVYSGAIWHGRPMLPSGAAQPVQYPDFKNEVKWFSSVASFARKMRKEEVKIEKENLAEEKEWEKNSG